MLQKCSVSRYYYADGTNMRATGHASNILLACTVALMFVPSAYMHIENILQDVGELANL